MFEKFIENYRKRGRIIEERGIVFYFINERGYILLIVLLISAFLVSFTSDFFLRIHTYIATMKRFRSDVNSEFVAYSGFEIAKTILDVDRLGLSKSFMPNLNSDRNIDCYRDIWALDFPEIPIMDYDLKIKIEDENSKINISSIANDLVNFQNSGSGSTYYGILQRFLMNLGLPLDIADALADWEDTDDVRSPYGAESSNYYFNLKPAYSAKNGPIDSIDELLLVKGVTPEIFFGLGGGNSGMEKNLVDDNKGDVTIPLYKLEEIMESASGQPEKKSADSDEAGNEKAIGKERSRRFSDYLSPYGSWNDFLEEINKININTASCRVLLSLSEDMTEDIVRDIIKKRDLQPYKSLDEAINDLESYIVLKDNIKNSLTIKSHIFKITLTAKNANSYCRVIYYYDRDNKKLLYCSKEH